MKGMTNGRLVRERRESLGEVLHRSRRVEQIDPLDAYVSEFLDIRMANTLEANGITTARELAHTASDRLLSIQNFGETSLEYVRRRFCERIGRVYQPPTAAA